VHPSYLDSPEHQAALHTILRMSSIQRVTPGVLSFLPTASLIWLAATLLLQIQDQDSQYYSALLLFRQDLSISYWWPLANFGKFI
jgi:hypothetical protein